jgi:hypothetical protein
MELLDATFAAMASGNNVMNGCKRPKPGTDKMNS